MSVRPRRNSWTRRGVNVVIAWPMADRSASGATTVTSPILVSASYSACRPGDVIPSSLVSRMRGAGSEAEPEFMDRSRAAPRCARTMNPGSAGDSQRDLAELLGAVEVLERAHDLV